MRNLTALLAAALLAFTTLAPAAADARDHRRGHGYYEYHDDYRYDRRRRHHRHRDNDGDALAAGVLGLILGVAIASAVNESRDRRDADRYYQDRRDYRDRYSDPYYDDYDRRSAYERDYGAYPPPAPQCTRRERQWDRYARRTVTVDVPC